MKSFSEKLDDNLATLAVILCILFGIIYGSIIILGPDNKIEDGIEDYIEENYGVDVDFSPDLP